MNLLCFINYSRTPETRTLKGNKKEFELAEVRVNGGDCKIQFPTCSMSSAVQI